MPALIRRIFQEKQRGVKLRAGDEGDVMCSLGPAPPPRFTVQQSNSEKGLIISEVKYHPPPFQVIEYNDLALLGKRPRTPVTSRHAIFGVSLVLETLFLIY